MPDWVGLKVSSVSSYLIGSGLVLGDVIGWLDDHAGAMGVVLGVLTLLMNLYFNLKRKNH